MVMLTSLHGLSRALTAHHHWNQSTSDWFDCGFYFGEDVNNTHSPDWQTCWVWGENQKTHSWKHPASILVELEQCSSVRDDVCFWQSYNETRKMTGWVGQAGSPACLEPTPQSPSEVRQLQNHPGSTLEQPCITWEPQTNIRPTSDQHQTLKYAVVANIWPVVCECHTLFLLPPTD